MSGAVLRLKSDPPVQSFSFNPIVGVLSFLAWGWNYRIVNAAGVGIALGICFLRWQARRRERGASGNMPPAGQQRKNEVKRI
jgi:hypothetical protein